MKHNPTIVITGANGFVGGTLVDYFAAKGWQVRALVRHASTHQNSAHVSYKEYDLVHGFDDAVFKGADLLVHAAYIKYDRSHPNAFDLNVQGAERLLAASRKHHLKKNVFMSSMSAHDSAISVYGKQKLAIEKLFSTNVDVSLRAGLIVGNGGLVHSIAGFIRSKRIVPLVDGGKQPLQIIGVNDLARVIERVLTGDFSGTFTVAHPEVVTNREFYAAVGRQLGVRPVFVPVPFWLILGIMRFAALLHLPLNVNEDNLWGLKMLRAVDTSADLQRLGLKVAPLETVLAHSNLTDERLHRRNRVS